MLGSRAPARVAGDSLWQSLLRLMPGDPDPWGGRPAPKPLLQNNVPAARAEFEACLNGLHGESIEELMRSIRRSRSLRDLWHLRTWLYTEVARAYSQREAEQRLALLNTHFIGAPDLLMAAGRRH